MVYHRMPSTDSRQHLPSNSTHNCSSYFCMGRRRWSTRAADWLLPTNTKDASYRSLLVSSHAGKVLHKTLRMAECPACEAYMQGQQYGGRRGVPVQLALHSTRAYLRTNKAQGRCVGILFLDLKEAFYRVVRGLVTGQQTTDELLHALASRLKLSEASLRHLKDELHREHALQQAHISEHAQRAIRALHCDTHFWLPGQKDVCRTEVGTRPGDSWADIIFGFAWAHLLHDVQDTLHSRGVLDTYANYDEWRPFEGPINGSCSDELVFLGATWMDDLSLCVSGSSCEEVEQRLCCAASTLLDTCFAYGMTPNLSKGKTEALFCFQGKGSRKAKLRFFGGHQNGKLDVIGETQMYHINVVGDYTHLGNQLHHTGNDGPEMRRRLAIAHQSFNQHRRAVYANHQITHRTRRWKSTKASYCPNCFMELRPGSLRPGLNKKPSTQGSCGSIDALAVFVMTLTCKTMQSWHTLKDFRLRNYFADNGFVIFAHCTNVRRLFLGPSLRRTILGAIWFAVTLVGFSTNYIMRVLCLTLRAISNRGWTSFVVIRVIGNDWSVEPVHMLFNNVAAVNMSELYMNKLFLSLRSMGPWLSHDPEANADPCNPHTTSDVSLARSGAAPWPVKEHICSKLMATWHRTDSFVQGRNVFIAFVNCTLLADSPITWDTVKPAERLSVQEDFIWMFSPVMVRFHILSRSDSIMDFECHNKQQARVCRPSRDLRNLIIMWSSMTSCRTWFYMVMFHTLTLRFALPVSKQLCLGVGFVWLFDGSLRRWVTRTRTYAQFLLHTFVEPLMSSSGRRRGLSSRTPSTWLALTVPWMSTNWKIGPTAWLFILTESGSITSLHRRGFSERRFSCMPSLDAGAVATFSSFWIALQPSMKASYYMWSPWTSWLMHSGVTSVLPVPKGTGLMPWSRATWWGCWQDRPVTRGAVHVNRLCHLQMADPDHVFYEKGMRCGASFAWRSAS